MAAEITPKKKPTWLDLAIVSMAVLLLISLCVFVFQVPYWPKFKANPNNADDTVEAFAYSLAYNRLDGVKEYVAEDKWTFLDAWSKDHPAIPVDCKEPDDPDPGSFWVSSFDESRQMHSISFAFRQDCPEYFYTFSISKVALKRVDHKWTIFDWVEICEETTERNCY